MHFNKLPVLDHPLVKLRPLRADDLPTWSNYLNDPVVFEHTSWNHPSPADLAVYVGSHDCGEPGHLLRLAIARQVDDALVGTIGYHTVSPGHRSAELAYDMAPIFWGRGWMCAAGEAMVRWAHENAGLLRVQATVLESNWRSQKTLDRLGFAREGLLRSLRLVRGRPGNFFMYAHVVTMAPSV
ncbi:MAG: GNAT family N-acetyltransferase [Burkholderiales bacterium]|nr:GNAT family N-acetyltransferase [Burkholderiales bacterium]